MHVMTTTSYYYEFLAIIDEVTLSITGNKGRFSHIVQIAAPWKSQCERLVLLMLCCVAGTNVGPVFGNRTSGDTVTLPVQQSWQELVGDNVTVGWYQDEMLQTLWIKLDPTYIGAKIITI